jgi:signal transduction histidine kinase
MPVAARSRSSAARRSARVEISIEDTGIGFRRKSQPHLRSLYDKESSGIGLSMVFRIVQLHDGEVEVQSTGRGTRFRLFQQV